MSGRPQAPISIRLARKTRVDADGCIVFTGHLDKQGYGRIWNLTAGEKQLVHRIAYEFHFGPIAPGLQVDHLCRNRACVNPDHLEAVTPLENTMRSRSPSAVNARRTRCIHGHPFTEANTRIIKGKRHCRACDARRQRAYRARQRAAA